MNDVVRCSVCDNQMPVSVEYCGVCGTMNPFYAVWKESGESGGAASPDVQPSAVASEEDQEAPIDFDYSALFGTQSQEETIPDTVPHGQSGDAPALDLASLFTWGEPEASTETPPTADTALAIEPAPAPEPVELPERVEPEGEAVAQAAAEPSSDASIEPEAEPEPDVEAAPEPLATLPEAAEVLVAPIEPLETPIASVETAPTS